MRHSRGFSLPELLISIAIIGVITAIVLVKYSSFDSTVLAKSAAYEVALSLREAQVKSVSVARGDSNFNNPFGVHFAVDAESFQSFVFQSSDTDTRVKYGDAATKLLLDTTFDRGMKIGRICINRTEFDEGTCDITKLDISFRRPEFRAVFHAMQEGDGGMDESIPESAKVNNAFIEMVNASGDDTFQIEITQLGQITVKKK